MDVRFFYLHLTLGPQMVLYVGVKALRSTLMQPHRAPFIYILLDHKVLFVQVQISFCISKKSQLCDLFAAFLSSL